MNHLDEDGKQKGENRRDHCVQEVFMVFFCLFPSLSLSLRCQGNDTSETGLAFTFSEFQDQGTI